MDKDDKENEPEEPPRIFCTLPPLLFKQNSPASIPIKVTGSPRPEIKWYIMGIPVDCCQGYKVSTGPGRRSHPSEILTVLEISSVDQSLEGAVEVTATNNIGMDRFVVPLKTYRLLSGIYLEEEQDKIDGKTSKVHEGCRTIDRRLFRNEVEEACKGIKVYQAYDNISKSYDNCTAPRDCRDPDLQQWRRKMAKRNLMKSIDDIVDDDCNSDNDRSIRTEPKQLGNSSFRSENFIKSSPLFSDVGKRRGETRAPNLLRSKATASGKCLDAFVEKSNGFKSSKADVDPKDLIGLFSFGGQKLSEFCENALRAKTADTNAQNSKDAEGQLSRAAADLFVYSNITESKIEDSVTGINTSSVSPLILYSQVNSSRSITRDPGRCEGHELDKLADEKCILGENIYENVCVGSQSRGVDEEEEVTKLADFLEEYHVFSEEYHIFSTSTESASLLQKGDEATPKGENHDADRAIPIYSRVMKPGRCREPQQQDSFTASEREGNQKVTPVVSVEPQKDERKTEDHFEVEGPTLRVEAEKLQNRSFHCKSENLEDSPVVKISEYSKSLDELTDSLSSFELRDKQEAAASKPPQSVRVPPGEGRMEKIPSPSIVVDHALPDQLGLAKPVSPQKPIVPPKPKFLKDVPIGHRVEGHGISRSPKQNADASSPLVQTACSSSSSSPSFSHASYDYSSTSTSPFSARSFTPSPGAAPGLPFSPRTPSTKSLSPGSLRPGLSPPSPASRLETSFTPSPRHSPDGRAPKSTFCSAKYKLVRPPGLDSFSESSSVPSTTSSATPSSSSSSSPLFVSPMSAPLSCPGSVEMSRKKSNTTWQPSGEKKSFRIYRLSSRDGKSSFYRAADDLKGGEKSGSSGNVSKFEGDQPALTDSQATARSLEVLPERRDSFASMEKYMGLGSSRKALSKRYELVTITTKDETVTLQNTDGAKFRRKSPGGTAFSNPPESLNAAERLYFLLGEGRERCLKDDEEEDGRRGVADADGYARAESRPKREAAGDSSKLRIERYKLPHGDRTNI